MEVAALATPSGPVRKQRVLCSCCATARWPRGTRARESPTCESPPLCPSRGTGKMPALPGAWGTKPVPWGAGVLGVRWVECSVCTVARSLSCQVSPSEHHRARCHHQSIFRPSVIIRPSATVWASPGQVSPSEHHQATCHCPVITVPMTMSTRRRAHAGWGRTAPCHHRCSPSSRLVSCWLGTGLVQHRGLSVPSPRVAASTGSFLPSSASSRRSGELPGSPRRNPAAWKRLPPVGPGRSGCR